VWLAAIHRAHDPQHPPFSSEVLPLKSSSSGRTQATAHSQTAVLTGSGKLPINAFD